MKHSAICIIGAGPAGIATSLTLAKMKIPHTIIDAAVFPRDKVCGDGLDTTVMRVLNSIEPGMVEKEILPNAHFTKSNSFLIHVNEKKKITINGSSDKFPGLPIFFFCRRCYFDNFLINKLDPVYARFLPGTKVEKIVHGPSEKRIHARQDGKEILINASMIIGADGDHSAVLRSLNSRKINRTHYAGALRQYWKGITDLNTNVFELYFPKSLPLGYLWIFPLENGEANVGIGMQCAILAKHNIDLKKTMEELIEKDPVINARFKNAQPMETMKGCGLPLASLERKLHGDGWLLTGDAASLICPTTGEGIGPAMLSGYIAAHFVRQGIEKNNFSEELFKHYDREVYKRMKGNILTYRLLQKTSSGLYGFFINYLMQSPYIKRKIITYFNRKIELAYTEKIPVTLN